MSDEILKLEPKALWKNFYNICQIPHPSKHEAQIVKSVVKFAEDHNLEHEVDAIGNVIIRKPATPGMENRRGVILQGHIDMVPQKNADKQHDFTKDPIETIIDNGWVRANGTTLGADNGIGCSAALAVLESKDIQHGPIEVLVTVDEETGMTGAFGLKAGMLKGDIFLNLDSETEGELYVGCAGGLDGNFTFTYTEEAVPANMAAVRLVVKGLHGGHSGMDIHLGRGNANKVLARMLRLANKYNVHLAEIDGGSLRNAIPREANAVILIDKAKVQNLKADIEAFAKTVKAELSRTEAEMEVFAEDAAMPAKMIDDKTARNLVAALYACPNGIMRMSDSMENLVETSNNLAAVKMENGKIHITCLLRSSVDSAKEDLSQMMASVFEMAGAEVSFTGAYPGWKPNMESPILKTMMNTYQTIFGKQPVIKAIHAGLECGLLGGVYPNWDMISFGPTIEHPHSPVERVNIESVGKFWKFMVETLKNIPTK